MIVEENITRIVIQIFMKNFKTIMINFVMVTHFNMVILIIKKVNKANIFKGFKKTFSQDTAAPTHTHTSRIK